VVAQSRGRHLDHQFTRRTILVGTVASVCAPAVVRAVSLMLIRAPIRRVIVPIRHLHAGFCERLRFHLIDFKGGMEC
jgi:hypothetical protein